MAELDSIRDIWEALEKAPGGPSIFQSWTWNRTWCEHVLAARRDMRLAVRLVEDGSGRPLAILPFYEQSVAGSKFFVTQFLAHRMATYNDVLLVDPSSEELADDVIQLLLNERNGWTFAHLRQLVGESVFASRLLGRGLAEQQCHRAWIHLDGPTADATARLSSQRRKSLRKAERRLQNMGVLEYNVRQRDELSTAFDRLIDLHHRRFQHKQKTSLLVGRNITFLKRAVERLGAQDQAEILEMRHDDVTIAAMLFIVADSCCYFLQTTFDPAFARYSPAWLLRTTAIQRASRDLGCQRCDMGAVYDAYKFNWKPTLATNYFANLGGRRWTSRFAAHAHTRVFRRRRPRLQEA